MKEPLFNTYPLSSALAATIDSLRAKIHAETEDYILKVNEAEYLAHLEHEFSAELPSLDLDKQHMLPPREYPVNDFDFGRAIRRTSTMIEIVVPFRGDVTLFRCTPSTSTYPRPSALLMESELHLMYEQVEHDESALQDRLTREVATIQRYLDEMRRDVDDHNVNVRRIARETFESRRARLASARKLGASLNLPIRRISGGEDTFAVPIVRRRATISRPNVSTGPWKPEPELEAAEFEYILGLLDRMGQVIERSPHAVARMDEESLRFLFLVPLNSHYDGGATGETFNFKGKTDILLQHEGRNVFVGECKVWGGPKVLTDALDQVLGYLSWRDTKAAILVFNRNKDFTNVLTQIPRVVAEHGCFVEDRGKRSETSFRFVLRQPSDAERRLSLTVLAFDIPSP